MPVKFCRAPGCGEFVKAGEPLCASHRAATYREQDQRRASAAARGYDRAWRLFRRRFLSGNPLCDDCIREGLIRVAEEVHHKIKLADKPALRLDPENVVALCKSCHSKRTMKGE